MTYPIKTTFFAAALLAASLLLTCLAPGAFAFTAVGNPSDNSGANLSAAIMAVYNSGAAGVTINPGTYTLTQPNTSNAFGDPNLDLSNISRPFEIDAYNVEMVMSGNHAGINFNYDSGLILKGATIDRRAPFGNQGVILALGTDSTGAYCDVQNDAGYPVTPYATWGYNTVLVGNSHVPRVDVPDLFGGTVTDLGSNRSRVHFTNIGRWGATTAQVGDYLVNCMGGAPLVKFAVCSNCTLQDITFLSSPCECTIIDYQGTGNHYLHDTITYGPPPPGATVAPMRTIGSGLQAQVNYVGPDVENCSFEGLGDDNNDLIGSYPAVTAVNGNIITADYDFWLWYKVTATHSEPIRLSNQAGEYLDTTVLQQQVITNPNGSQSSVLTLAATPPSDFVATSARASNPNMNCPGYKFINDTFRDSRGHGIVARGDNGLIQNCTFANLAFEGVFIGPSSGGYNEADYSHNVTIQNNVFTNNPGLIINSDGARGNANISITGNVFANTTGLFYNYGFVPGTKDNPSIAALGVSGLTIANNTFADLGQQTSIGGPHPNSVHAVNIQNSSQITLGNNLLTNPGANTASPVYVVDAASQQSITGMNAGSFANLIYPQEYITLTNVAAGLNLDDPNYSTQAGTLLQLYPANGVSAQNWQVNWQADGSCTLANQASNGLVLDDIAYGGIGTYQQLYYVDGATAQEYWFIPSTSSSYLIKNVAAGLYLDVPSTSQGSHVWLNTLSGNTTQNWQVNPAPGTAPPGTTLTQGQYLVSPHGQYYLIQQGDGNLVLYAGSGPSSQGALIWQSGYTAASGDVYTIMQGDGNLVTYLGTPSARGGAVWASGTYNSPGAYLAVTDGGQVQILNGNTVVWQRPATANYPAPTISSLSPASATAGAAPFTMTVTGTNFLSSSTLSFGGTALTLTGQTATTLTATVPASAVAAAGSKSIAVTNPAPGGGTASMTFTVSKAAPSIALTASPNPATSGQNVTLSAALSGGTAPTGTVQFQDGGINFGAPVPVSGGQASVTANTLSVGTHQMTAAYSGDTSNSGATTPATAVTIASAPVKPVLSSLSPASRTAGGSAFTLTVKGTGFVSGSMVQWNGAAQPTTFVSSTQMTAAIAASLITTAGKVSVTVNTPGVGVSGSKTLTVNPRPVISSLSPTSVKVGSAAFTLTVNGTGFLSNSIIKWNGSAQATTYVGSTKLTASIPASLLTKAGTVSVKVTSPGVATSGKISFTVAP